MRNKLTFTILPLLFLILSSFGPVNQYLRKAARQTGKGNIKAAKSYYQRALEKEPDNFKANLGMGLLLSEVVEDYAHALPYLEKALSKSKKDTLGDLFYALGKSYHHAGEYKKAIAFYDRIKNYRDFEGELEFQKEIPKRIQDCNYALVHENDKAPLDFYTVNAGKSINTEMPEYVPVLTPQSELIFTSKRQDDKKEELNYLDGKYFESMYIAKIEATSFKDTRRYTLPDQFLKSKYRKGHESVVSMSPDGKKLFTYHNNKIFEINMDERLSQKPQKLLKTINFDYYQNHAFLTKDGNTLYFTSEADGGLGGIDIYKATKQGDGQWSKPENIGAPVNTTFDEDAPFVTDDGKTLYFASKGHEGFGNYDIYKCTLIDGKWANPVNLGKPVNSAGNDIFMVLNANGDAGYFSSSRNGGYGDMDIYKIVYLNNNNIECPAKTSEIISTVVTDENPKDFANKISVKVPANFTVLSYEWNVNGTKIDHSEAELPYDFKRGGLHITTSKVTAYCDTCLAVVAMCFVTESKFDMIKIDTGTVTTPVTTVDLSTFKGELTTAQLTALGFNINPVLFDLNKSEVRNDGESIINTNIAVLKKYPSLKVEIIGYTDARGSETRNKTLSAQRAIDVKKYMNKSGVPLKQIKQTQGKGSNELVNNCGKDQNCDEAAHQQNRRVIFKVYN